MSEQRTERNEKEIDERSDAGGSEYEDIKMREDNATMTRLQQIGPQQPTTESPSINSDLEKVPINTDDVSEDKTKRDEYVI